MKLQNIALESISLIDILGSLFLFNNSMELTLLGEASYSKVFHHVMGHTISLPYSTGPSPEPDESSPYHPIPFPSDPF
jgi:hypothetical protein